MACPICNSSNLLPSYSLYDDRYGYPGKFQLVQCGTCKHAFLDGSFSSESLTNLYSNYYPRSALNLNDFRPYKEEGGFFAWLKGTKSAAFRWVPKNVRILDIGCGFGQALAYHRDRGCDVYGVEADQNIQRVAERFGFKVHVGLFSPEHYEPNLFDYITMSQVIEHVTDPVEVMRGIAKILKPGGMAILSTPNAGGLGARLYGRRWINWHIPYHLHFFSQQSLQLAAENAGMSLEKIETITPSDWLCYQWIHLLDFPHEGESSSFWNLKSGNPSILTQMVRKLIVATKLILVPQLITRLVDATGYGDNYIVILTKPKDGAVNRGS